MHKDKISRRRFLKAAATTVSLPVFIPSSVLGRGSAVAPSERITLAAIGMGPRCKHVLEHFMLFDDVRCVAVCDCRSERVSAAKAHVDEHYGNNDCATYSDFREVLARDDIDAVLIATGDRWHALTSIMAAKAGKDVYSEKPMTLTIEEGQVLVETMKRFGTIYQCGHQRRSVDSYRFQIEVVRSGMIGEVHTVIAQQWADPIFKPEAPQPVPEGFDYEMWLGPTPWHPYMPVRIKGWNYFWDTGGGVLVGMGCHYTDIAQWGLEKDDTGPIHFEGSGEFVKDNFADTPVRGEATCTYADGRKVVMISRGAFADRFIRFVGTEGWIQVDDGTNVVTAEPKSILRTRQWAAGGFEETGNHIGNFLNCVRTRQETVSSPGKSHRATVISHAINICLRLGRPVQWDPATEQFVNDTEANKMISRSMRPPWRL